MNAYELANDYANILRAFSTVAGMLRHYRDYYARTKSDTALRGVRRQQRRLRAIRKATMFIARSLERVKIPTTKKSVARVWPAFVRRLDGRLQRSWRQGNER